MGNGRTAAWMKLIGLGADVRNDAKLASAESIRQDEKSRGNPRLSCTIF
jgi:hypothetical protein